VYHALDMNAPRLSSNSFTLQSCQECLCLLKLRKNLRFLDTDANGAVLIFLVLVYLQVVLESHNILWRTPPVRVEFGRFKIQVIPHPLQSQAAVYLVSGFGPVPHFGDIVKNVMSANLNLYSTCVQDIPFLHQRVDCTLDCLFFFAASQKTVCIGQKGAPQENAEPRLRTRDPGASY